MLLVADGLTNTRIAKLTGSSVVTVFKWRTRYEKSGIAGLGDGPRSGRPKHLDGFDIVTTTLMPPPKKCGVTHWSTRLLGKRLGVGNATLARAWREYGAQPWKTETFKLSTDPDLEAKVTNVIGLFLAPPNNAVVLRVDELCEASHSSSDVKSQIQALDRTAPLLPMRMGDAKKRTHDYHRHGTSTLFAALEVATGQITGAVRPRHRRQEFLSFLRQIDRAYPDVELHLVMDNYATHKTAEVRQWLEARPRFHVRFTPTSGSWLNLVEVWFGIIDRQAIKRGVFTSVKNLNKKIRAFITCWNKRKHAFV